jgi:cob(I)alamin adenosyltransferase
MASTESTAAELTAITDNVAQYRARLAGLAEPWIGTERDDVVTAIHEAERQLRNAERTLLRALRTVE